MTIIENGEVAIQFAICLAVLSARTLAPAGRAGGVELGSSRQDPPPRVIRDSFNWPRAQSTLAWESKKQPLKALDSRIPAPASISAAAAAKPDRIRRGISEALPRGISSEIRAEEPQRQTCPARRPLSQRCAKLQKATPIQTSLSLSFSFKQIQNTKGSSNFYFLSHLCQRSFQIRPKREAERFLLFFLLSFPFKCCSKQQQQ